MRLYLSADIEGTCGIADWAETERATMDDYRPFAAQSAMPQVPSMSALK